MKTLKICFIAIILFTCLTGCYDAAEVDEELYSLVIGIDKGINNKLRLTLQYPTYKEKGGGGIPGGDGQAEGIREVDSTIVVTVEAPTILESMNLINASVPRRVSLMHAKMVIFSEEYAREGIMNYLGPFQRYRETRSEMLIAVCNGKAEDFIKENKSAIGESTSKFIELFRVQADWHGYYPITTFHEFYKHSLSQYQHPFAIYAGITDYSALKQETGEGKLRAEYNLLAGDLPLRGTAKREFGGTAIFSKGKMVGTLNIFETRYFTMVTGKFKRAIMTIEDRKKPEAAIPLDIRLGRKPNIKVYIKDGRPTIDINLNIEADIGAIQSRYPYESLNNIEDLNKQISEHIKNNIEQVIQKTKELKADIFGFGYYLSGNFLTIEEWEKYDWHEEYPKSRVNVNVDVNVRRTGIMFESFQIKGES